jgi:hypothetical protein
MILTDEQIWAELLTYLRGDTAQLQRFTGETLAAHPNVNLAHAKAEDEIRSVVEGVHAWPLDSWPPALLDVLVALVFDRVTKGAAVRPSWIERDAEWARGYLNDIKMGRRTIRDTDPDTPGGRRLPSAEVRLSDNPFDIGDDSSDLNRIRPSFAGPDRRTRGW